ncbi:peptidoglycan DD-metalloendopeptidase family protein [Thermomonas brevis]|uniref:Peptidoglycan DD-metalloendopeptidase family protein n=1 Tax=Thermomonas brevis TaxID=215691 RepID=A0A7G9QQG2_9GAMM|nr:peptidoglycan DD-metalloendopeptidase family protein [Thermomonas brevis]QNN45587.1 peptidoglycan DD-metalloendopeptidase family protein [Thermomonas brevis]
MTDSNHDAVRRENLERARANADRPDAAPLSHPFRGRWTRRHWAHASVLTTMGVLLAAIVPGFSTLLDTPVGANAQRMTLALTLPKPGLRASKATDDNWQSVTLKPGQTLSGVFEELGIPYDQLTRVMQHPKIKPTLRKLRPGTELSFNLPADGSVRAMRLEAGPGIGDAPIELEFSGDTLRERAVPVEITTRTVVLTGEVGKSLFASARKLGLGSAQLSQLTDEMFKYDIDFDSDLGEDDRFSVVVDQTWKNGQLVNTGPVLAATFTVDGKLKSAFRYMRDGKPEYFTPDGRSLRRPFIRMPIPYARISSGFGMRKHPVLGRMRGHMGIDYAAGTGTPIMAAGDARVEFVGRKGGYGNAVILNHGGGKTTLYGHMSRFANIRAGQRVAQGTVIGYVGSTGLATGPHLHYEFRVNGVHMNPLKMTLPPPTPLTGTALVAFKSETHRALDKIREVEDVVFQLDDDSRVASAAKPAPPARKKG